MATIQYVPTPIAAFGEQSHHILWEALVAASLVGNALEMPGSSDRSVQVVGTWDSATFVLEGSNDGTTWATLTDPQGNAISKTANFIEMISELTRYIRPRISGGSGSEDLDVHVLVKRVR